jgi:hypothetical protein
LTSTIPSTEKGALADLPSPLRIELIEAFNRVIINFREGRWEPSELNGGKFCEVVYTILNGAVAGSYPARAKKPRNMFDACRALEGADKTKFSRSLRIQIPRVLIALYEVRNNRGVGHVGGDVDPNHMDASLVVAECKWVMAELIRIFHGITVSRATQIVEALIERELPIIWSINGKKRVLDASLKMKPKTLLLLYGSMSGLDETKLVVDLEHSNATVYRRDVLVPLHKDRMIEYDKKEKIAHISPLGVRYVEKELLPKLTL